jgi:hypothetical protein
MDTNQPNTTRRQALGGLALTAALGAVAGIALTDASPASASVVDRSEWNGAVDRFKRAVTNCDRAGAAHDAAFEAVDADCPSRRDFFERYRLSATQNRAENVNRAAVAVAIERGRSRDWESRDGLSLREAIREDIAADDLEANRIVDEFESWSARRQKAVDLHRVHRLDKDFDVAFREREVARNALFNSPAPDHAALLEKIDLLASMMSEAEVDDAEHMSTIKADARRLLTIGRA